MSRRDGWRIRQGMGMALTGKQRIALLIALFSIYLIASATQSLLLINCDVSWDMRITQRLLAGGNYVRDFFDTNPPMILLLYIPPVMLAKLLVITNINALYLYIFLLATVAIGVSYLFISRLFSEKDKLLACLFLIVIAGFLLILPLYEFGQREHLLLIFTIPYFLSTAYRLQGKTLNPYYGVLIGIAAGVGFAIKPYFLMAPVLVEIYYIFQHRKLMSMVRPEAIAMLLLLTVYLSCIFIFFPQYITTIVPMGAMFYYTGFSNRWEDVFQQPILPFCLGAGILYFLLNKKNTYRYLASVLFAATIGYLFSYFIQRTSWSYHYYPAFFTTSLLCLLLVNEFELKVRRYRVGSALTILLIVSIMLFPANYLYDSYKFIVFENNSHRDIVAFLNTAAKNKSLYFFSATPNEMLTAADYSDVIYESRFQHLVWVPGAVKKARANKTGKLTPEQSLVENKFINMVNEDFTAQKPDLVFVDTTSLKRYFEEPFDYLKYFSANAQFNQIWKNYHYLTTIQDDPQNNHADVKEWNIYQIADIKDLHPENIKGHTIILTGTDNHRAVYYVKRNHILHFPHYPLTQQIQLSDAELQFLQNNPGNIVKTAANRAMVNQLIISATACNSYKYDVYQRNSLSPGAL